ncbi:hypothetical protein, partial [Pseudomonas amygdali]|uniref:hypothetical protein n=1 Tax=Pseudomonas amygdali TaxID=47877 RepID=UPI0011AEF2D7
MTDSKPLSSETLAALDEATKLLDDQPQMANSESAVQISKPRIAIILVVYALGLWAALQFLSALYGYFAYDSQHPYTVIAHLIGLDSPFKTISQLSFFDGAFALGITLLSVVMIYLWLAACTLLGTLALGEWIGGTKKVLFKHQLAHGGVFQGSCRVNRLTMLLFSQRLALDPGLTARRRSVPSCVSPST